MELLIFTRGLLCVDEAKFDRFVARRNGIERFVRRFVRTFRLRESRGHSTCSTGKILAPLNGMV